MSLIKKIKDAEQKAANNALRDRNLVFVHVPKNYGTTTADFLFRAFVDSDNGDRSDIPAHITTHMTAPQITSLPKYANHDTFCFTRNPYSRFVSVVKWRTPKDTLLGKARCRRRLRIEVDDYLFCVRKALKYIAERKVQKPIDYKFETDPEKLDRMFLPQTTWHNRNTFLYQCEDYYNELWRFIQEHNISRTKKPNRGVKYDGVFGDFIDNEGKPIPKNMIHRNRSHSTVESLSYKEMFYDILRKDSGIHREFIDYYRTDFSLFDYEPESLS